MEIILCMLQCISKYTAATPARCENNSLCRNEWYISVCSITLSLFFIFKKKCLSPEMTISLKFSLNFTFTLKLSWISDLFANNVYCLSLWDYFCVLSLFFFRCHIHLNLISSPISLLICSTYWKFRIKCTMRPFKSYRHAVGLTFHRLFFIRVRNMH